MGVFTSAARSPQDLGPYVTGFHSRLFKVLYMLRCISGGLTLYPLPKDVPCLLTRDQLTRHKICM